MLPLLKRSPVLGFNHNVRHRGLTFHVQTEDSGVDNPHVHTHLFNGGVIVFSRKLDYDAESDPDVVKSLMQAQHKAVLKELKKGAFDERIDEYFGDDPKLLPPGTPDAVPKTRRHDTESDGVPAPLDDDDSDTVATPAPPEARALAEPLAQGLAAKTLEQAEPEVVFDAPAKDGAAPIGLHDQPTAPVDRGGRPPPIPGGRTRRPAHSGKHPAPSRGRRTSSPGVVVSRPAVIVGKPARDSARAKTVVDDPEAQQAQARRSDPARGGGLFGQDLISEKSLDEVILAYLSEDPEE